MAKVTSESSSSNLQTVCILCVHCSFMTPARQKEKAKETMDIYAPIAQRPLEYSKIKTELDDLALKIFTAGSVRIDLVIPSIKGKQTEREEL